MGNRFFRLVLGPRAASSNSLRDLVEHLRRSGYGVEVRLTWERGDATRWAAEEAAGEVIVACGGDGTLNEVVRGIVEVEEDRAAGLLPFGTANDLASACGLTAGRPVDAFRVITRGELRHIDLGKATLDRRETLPFVNAATAGLGAAITAATPSALKRRLGSWSYLLSGIAQAGQLENMSIEVKAPDLHWRGEALMLAVGNGPLAGGGIRLCPNARLDDGLLDLMILPALPSEDLIPLLGDRLIQGRFVGDSPVVYRQVPWVEIRSEQRMHVNLDGQPETATELRVELFERPLPIYLPANELLGFTQPQGLPRE